MKLVQCPNKHYYDADKFKECPICHPAMANRVDLDRQEDQGEDKKSRNIGKSKYNEIEFSKFF